LAKCQLLNAVNDFRGRKIGGLPRGFFDFIACLTGAAVVRSANGSGDRHRRIWHFSFVFRVLVTTITLPNGKNARFL
jgi:hypothetical protein